MCFRSFCICKIADISPKLAKDENSVAYKKFMIDYGKAKGIINNSMLNLRAIFNTGWNIKKKLEVG